MRFDKTVGNDTFAGRYVTILLSDRILLALQRILRNSHLSDEHVSYPDNIIFFSAEAGSGKV